jgi:poly-gamma-glutamate capsule biosynthesis protein CapA/YwtB (metallophosphatase superfamily)
VGTAFVMRARKRPALLLPALLLLALAVGLGPDSAKVGAGNAPVADLSDYPWFYLRDGQPPAAGEVLVELVAVGDVMPGRGVLPVEAPLAQVAGWLRTADLVLGNLEAAIVAGEPVASTRGNEQYLLWAPPRAASMLADAGFDLLSLANNHSLDGGSSGLEEAAQHLLAAGIMPVGAGAGAEAYRAVLLEVRGVPLAFLAFNAVPTPGNPAPADRWQRADWDEARAVAAVQAARAQASAVIVTIHWGYEYDLRADPGQIRIANVLLDAGADLVLGHHPHVVQPVAVEEADRGTVIAYSLGNFLFDQGSGETGQGLALRVFFDGAGLRAVQALPLAVGRQPHLLPVAAAEELLARVAPPARQHVFSCSDDGCQQLTHTSRIASGSGLFWSGEIDLTGDGEPELVRRAGEQVTVYAGDSAVWQSPAGWRVVDVALGDPNDDGRGEMVLALRRTDAGGYERSQPYIVGYRGGDYRLLWGGRAVAAPILEVELGDVSGDGRQELIVLEAHDEGARLAVWRWQGWSFSLVWRSQPGPFRNLSLQPAAGGMLLVVDVAR